MYFPKSVNDLESEFELKSEPALGEWIAISGFNPAAFVAFVSASVCVPAGQTFLEVSAPPGIFHGKNASRRCRGFAIANSQGCRVDEDHAATSADLR